METPSFALCLKNLKLPVISGKECSRRKDSEESAEECINKMTANG